MLEPYWEIFAHGFGPVIINTGLLAILVYCASIFRYELFSHKNYSRPSIQLTIGLLFGLSVAILMLFPFEFEPGIIADARGGPLLLSGVIAGPLSALVTTVIAVAMRYYLGGTGMLGGIIYIVIFGLSGVILFKLNKFYNWKNTLGISKLVQLAIAATILSMPVILMFPEEKQITILVSIWPKLFAANVIGVAILGFLINRERRHRMTEKHMNAYFDNADISIWIEDHSNIYDTLMRLREDGITDIRKYLDENEQAAWNMAAQIVIKKVNRATLKLFDANSSDEFISNIDETFGPGAIDVFKKQICAIWEKKKSFRAEIQFRTLEGREIFCIISLPIPNTKNEFTNVPVSIIDITVRKQLEKQLQHTQKMDAIDQLTGGIAHDYNNILGIVQGNFEILRHMLAGNEKAIERIKAGLLGAKRGTDLTRKLLNFSTTSVSGTKLISLRTLVKDITDLIAKSLTVSVNVNICLDDDIWKVRIDPGDLQDVLINLAINARDAMPEGGQLTIEIKNKTLNEKYSKLNQQALSGEFVMIAVSDTGHGMTPEIQERILEPFFTTKGRNKGSGLGLSMVYGFVQRSGGQLRIHSEVDKGSVFQIYLPRRFSQDRDLQENEVAEISLLTGSEAILIVDDEVDLSDIAQAHLQDLGYKTVVAENGIQALEILHNRSDIDLMFTDVVMPGEMDGYKLVLKAHELHPKLRILLTSGYAKRPDKLNSDEDFVVRQLSNNLLSKPYNESDLSLAVRQALDSPPIDLRIDA